MLTSIISYVYADVSFAGHIVSIQVLSTWTSMVKAAHTAGYLGQLGFRGFRVQEPQHVTIPRPRHLDKKRKGSPV